LVTYKRSSTDAPRRTSAAKVAVSRADNRVGVHERTTAEVRSGELDADDEGEVTSGSSHATNNVLGVLIPVVGEGLGQGSASDESWESRESDEEGVGDHVGEA
jgi:hypothetical protein